MRSPANCAPTRHATATGAAQARHSGADQADEFADFVRISPQRSINVEGLEEGLKEAQDFGADVVIVDHIDHIAGGDGTNLYAESVAVNDAALRMAQTTTCCCGSRRSSTWRS
jgi:hypothetical protein